MVKGKLEHMLMIFVDDYMDILEMIEESTGNGAELSIIRDEMRGFVADAINRNDSISSFVDKMNAFRKDADGGHACRKGILAVCRAMPEHLAGDLCYLGIIHGMRAVRMPDFVKAEKGLRAGFRTSDEQFAESFLDPVVVLGDSFRLL